MKQFTTNNWFYDLVLRKYFQDKETQSRMIFNASQATQRKQSINLSFQNEQQYINEVNNYIQKNIRYTADPLTFDYYTHPELLQKCIDDNDYKFSSDCDDMAVYAYHQLSKHIDKKKLTVVSIIPNLFPEVTNIKFAHVICIGLFSLRWSDGLAWVYTIDTNGLNWYSFKLDSYQDIGIDDLLEFKVNSGKVKDLILNRFSEIYKTKYVLMINHGYPF